MPYAIGLLNDPQMDLKFGISEENFSKKCVSEHWEARNCSFGWKRRDLMLKFQQERYASVWSLCHHTKRSPLVSANLNSVQYGNHKIQIPNKLFYLKKKTTELFSLSDNKIASMVMIQSFSLQLLPKSEKMSAG